jgi:hypothetical protein
MLHEEGASAEKGKGAGSVNKEGIHLLVHRLTMVTKVQSTPII